jgi:hypothetical protein
MSLEVLAWQDPRAVVPEQHMMTFVQVEEEPENTEIVIADGVSWDQPTESSNACLLMGYAF